MKIFRYLLPVMFIGAGFFTSCDTDPEPEQVVFPYTYSDLYYQNLRDYKASDHQLAWGWFADYTQMHSPAIRFAGLPDSIDIVSLWGGIPSDVEGRESTKYLPEVAKEMRYIQQVKGVKLVVPTIVRIRDFADFYEIWQNESPEAGMEAFAQYLLRPIFENDLDGLDLDYEPEGDPLSGDNFDYFVQYIGQFIGPMADPANVIEGTAIKGDPTKLLCIDYYNQRPSANTDQYTNLYVNQTYGGSPGGLPFTGCATEKVIYTENVGDNYKAAECGQLLNYARYKPATGRKGGFGAFYIHRDYQNAVFGCTNYGNFRHGIQIQNPAIY